MNKQLILFLALLCAGVSVHSQEIVKPLKFSAETFELYQEERSFPERQDRTERDGALSLPFIDDFSRYSLQTDNPDIPLEWQMWTDNSSRINNTLVKNAPTHGVATLDGLDSTGYPYDFFDEFSYGPADTLTSCPIDMAGLTSEDSVKLIFHYQRGGMGNAPEFQDSLILEMALAGTNPVLWQYVWSTPGGAAMDDFERVFIPIEDLNLLHESSQFRFRNFSTLSGNVDHWNIDYVRLDQDIEEASFSIIDVAPSSHETSLLNLYQSIPWSHFQTDPEGFMASTEDVVFSNLDDDRNISFGVDIDFEGVNQASLDQLSSTADNAMSFLTRQMSINDGTPNNYVFDENIADTCATFKVSYYSNTSPDVRPENDTLTFEQHFGNYYAYDDGSAEGAYALNESGSAISMKFTNHMEDSLLGLLIHFAPYGLNNDDELFFLRAWNDDGGSVGEEMEEQFNAHYPQYFSDGYDKFVFYEYDNPLFIEEGDYYVGFVQSTGAELNVGYDKHNNVNIDKLYYRLGPTGSFQQSGVQGALMIRPVFKSDKDLSWDFVNVEEQNEPKFNLYPNPAEEFIFSDTFSTGQNIEVYNSVGALVQSSVLSSNQLFVGDLPKGIYVIRILESGAYKGVATLIKN